MGRKRFEKALAALAAGMLVLALACDVGNEGQSRVDQTSNPSPSPSFDFKDESTGGITEQDVNELPLFAKLSLGEQLQAELRAGDVLAAARKEIKHIPTGEPGGNPAHPQRIRNGVVRQSFLDAN